MRKKLFFQAELKSAAADDAQAKDGQPLVIEGYASTPEIDRYDEIIDTAAFAGAIPQFLKNPVLLRQHEPDKPVGTIVAMELRADGLFVRAEVYGDTEVCRDTQAEIRNGSRKAFSIGFWPLSTELRMRDGSPFDPQKASPWDKDVIRVIKELDLCEISVVTVPANAGSLFSMANSVSKFFSDLAVKAMSGATEGDAVPDNEVVDAPKAPAVIEEPKPADPSVPPVDPTADDDDEDDKPEAPVGERPTAAKDEPKAGEQPVQANPSGAAGEPVEPVAVAEKPTVPADDEEKKQLKSQLEAEKVLREEAEKKATDAIEKLKSTPGVQPLAPVGQFGTAVAAAGKKESAAKKGSGWFTDSINSRNL